MSAMRPGQRAWLRIPNTPAVACAGLLDLQGREVTMVRRWSAAGLIARCWVVTPPLRTTLNAPCTSDAGQPLRAGQRLTLRAVPEAWLRRGMPAWSAQELEFLREHYGTWPTARIADHLGRGLAATRTKVMKLGLRCRTVWTPALDEVVSLMFPDTAANAIGELVGATPAAVRQRGAHLGLRKDAGFAAACSRTMNLARSRFTPEISEIIELLYPDTVTQAIADFVGMPLERVHAYAHHQGWKKTPEFVRETARARTGPDHPMRRFQFPKGHVPANKGRRGISYPGMEGTQFKKGNRPQTWVPVGSFRICEGALQKKLNDNPGPNRARWFPVHRLMWEAAHGPVPPGHIVRFKPGQATTALEEITLERLECVSYAQNMQRNSFRTNYPPELVKLIQTRGHMQRMINKRQKALTGET